MNNWQNYTISELCDIKVSGVDKKIYANEIPVQLCNYMDAYRNDYLTRQTDYSIGSVNHNELRKFNLVKNDVVITKDSETPEDIAVSSVVLEDLENVVCGYHLAILQPRDEVDGTFLMHSLKLPSNQRLFYKIASGSTRYGLTIGGIESVTLKIPSLPAQRKVAKILKMCDTVISQTEQAIKKYEAIKQGMMTDLFTRGIDVNTGKLRPNYEEEPGLYKESELGWVPKDWDVIFLCSIINVSSGQGLSQAKMKSGIFPVYGGNGITGYHNDYLFNESRLIIGRVGEHCGNVHRTQKYSWITDNALIVKPVLENEFNPDFWFYLLSYIKLNDFAFAAAQPVITGGIIKKILVANIGLIEQKLIVEAISTIDKKIRTEQETLKKYQQIKAGLMQDLLTGKVQVQTDDVA